MSSVCGLVGICLAGTNGVHAASSASGSLVTAMGAAHAVALASAFDARDRSVAVSAGRVFTSVRAPGLTVVVR